jgi:hypothetical protein
MLIPLSLLGAFARPLGYLSLGLAAVLLLVFLAEAIMLLREPEEQLRLGRILPPALEVGDRKSTRLNSSH